MSGDMDALISLLADDVTLWSDGGGRVVAARNPIHGSDRVARFLLGIMREAPAGLVFRRLPVNGRPGLVGAEGSGARPEAKRSSSRRSWTIASKQPARSQRWVCW